MELLTQNHCRFSEFCVKVTEAQCAGEFCRSEDPIADILVRMGFDPAEVRASVLYLEGVEDLGELIAREELENLLMGYDQAKDEIDGE